MKLWYVSGEMAEARAAAEKLVDSLNAEIPLFITGDVKVRMAWREDREFGFSCMGKPRLGRVTYIPEADILVNGQIVKRELLDHIALDLYHLEMAAIKKSGISIARQ